VVKLWAGWPRNCDSTSSRGSGFFCFKSIQLGLRPSCPLQRVLEALSLNWRQLGYEVDHSAQSTAS
jgi:hypothetical protein